MATENVSKLQENILKYPYNPSLIQRNVHDHLDYVLNGTMDIVDPMNPFVFLMEASCVLTATAMSKTESATRAMYAKLVQTENDLYRHMSDEDYVDRFAVPSKATISLLFFKEEIIDKMVYDSVNAYYKIVIPRNTVFTVSETSFSLQYPIEIRKLSHGGLQVVYDGTIVSPLKTLETNIIDWEIRVNAAGEWIYFQIEVDQFAVQTYSYPVTAGASFKKSVAISDSFYYARAYVENNDGSWTEIKTTHSEQVYDPATPTLVLRLADGSLTATLPQIYINTGLVSTTVRIDVYETKGDISLDLGAYPSEAFTAKWLALDTDQDDPTYSAPLSSIKYLLIYSDSNTTGGAAAQSTAEIRSSVINNANGKQDIPITPAQIEGKLARSGYSIIKNVDNVTNRVYLATKPMPAPSNQKLITASAANIHSVITSFKSAVANSTVIDNGDSVTITPDTLFQVQDGLVVIAPNGAKEAIMALSVEERALKVTSGNYLWTPFHYVLDASGSEFDARAYYLDKPSIVSKSFGATNDTLGLEIGTDSISIAKEDKRFVVTLVTNTSDEVKEMGNENFHVQLAYIPDGEVDRAYLTGNYIGKTSAGEWVYEFYLDSSLDVNSSDSIELTSFQMYSPIQKNTRSPLEKQFDILYSYSGSRPSQWVSAAIDTYLGRFQLPALIAAVTHETLKIKFGDALEQLWVRSRTMVETLEYETYPEDVLSFWEEDVYERDANGSAVQIVDGAVVFKKLHSKGDPVLLNGEQVIKYKKGTVVRDAYGKPVVKNERGLQHQVDILFLEGPYSFATDTVAVGYRKEIISTLLSWITKDLESINKRLLERTKVYFYPKATIGKVDVLVGDGMPASIDAGQAFVVDLYVSDSVYANSDLRSEIERVTVTVLNDELDTDVVAISKLKKSLRESYGNDVLDVELSGIDDGKYTIATILDDAARLSIRKKLVAQTDGSLTVKEDITVNFFNHSLKS